MAYIPIVPPVAVPPSPRARELGGLLSQVIDEYGKHHPELSAGEVREALALARRDSGGDVDRQLVKGLVVGLVLVLGMAAVVGIKLSADGIGARTVVLVAISVVAVAFVLKRAVDL